MKAMLLVLEVEAEADPSLSHVGMVYSETGSGVIHDVQAVGAVARAMGRRLIVDERLVDHLPHHSLLLADALRGVNLGQPIFADDFVILVKNPTLENLEAAHAPLDDLAEIFFRLRIVARHTHVKGEVARALPFRFPQPSLERRQWLLLAARANHFNEGRRPANQCRTAG